MAETLPSASEQLELIGELYEGHTKRFDADEQSEDIQMWAWSYWKKWPMYLGMTWGKIHDAGQADTDKSYHLRQKLNWTFESATRWLMREAERRGIDSSPLAKCVNLVGEMILSPDLLTVGIGATSSHCWPDFLGKRLYEMSELMQQAILEGNATFERLIAKLEIDLLAADIPTELDNLTHEIGTNGADKSDTKSDTEKKNRKVFPLTNDARKVATEIKRRRKKGNFESLESDLPDILSELKIGKAPSYIKRILSDYPTEWRE